MRLVVTRLFILISISSALVGCASSKDAVLPHDGPTMKAIYDAHFEGMNAASTETARNTVGSRPLLPNDEAFAGFTRDSLTELDLHFPRLPNPTLVMYVFPHLAGPSRVPVPGYATTFPMYEHAEYALPGEVPPPPAPVSLQSEPRP